MLGGRSKHLTLCLNLVLVMSSGSVTASAIHQCVSYHGPMCWKQAPLWGVACLSMALSHVCSWPWTHFGFSGLREELLLPPFRSAPSSLPAPPPICLLTKGGTGSSHLSFAKRRQEVLRSRSRRLWGTRNAHQTVQILQRAWIYLLSRFHPD